MSTKQKNAAQFDSLFKVLNEPQKRAVETIEGPVLVIACPGTGKTTILTLRIANILRLTDTAPENILALTFTESGAFVMRRKLLEIIGPAAYKVRIHTYHGYAESIIQQYPDYFMRIIGSKIITEAEQLKIVERILQSRNIKLLRPYGDPLYYVKPILQEIHILKRENISPDTMANSLDKSQAKNLELAFVYKKYEEALAEQKYYDFDDMLLELIRVMDNDPTFKLLLQEDHHYILADEHQDANAAQNRILELLADFHNSPNLFIVGDDKQAIYRFQGASLENFLYFSKKYAEAVVIELTHNYRSHQGILDASHSLISNNPSVNADGPKRLVSLQIGTKPIFVDEFATRSDELEYLSVIVERLIKKSEKSQEIAILYRENKTAEAISEAFRAHNIPHRIESDHNILDDIDTTKLIILAKAIYEPSNSEYLAKALLLPELQCDPGEVSELCQISQREKVPLHHLIVGGTGKASSIFRPAGWTALPKKRTSLAGTTSQFKPVCAGRDIKIAYARIVKWSHESQTTPILVFLQKIIQETHMLADIVASADSLERLASLNAFFDRIRVAADSRQDFYLKEFIEYVLVIRDHGLLAKRSYVDHTNGVRLMTAHRAKGQEFNHVFIVHAEDGTWGNRKRRSLFTIPIIEHARDTGKIEDERRLFYVAMTRARESVNISYSRREDDKERIPSQFIAEIEPSLIEFEKPIVVVENELFLKKITPPTEQKTGSILDPQFVRSKFLAQPLSVTHLNNFLECPWRYFFVNLLRVPQAQTKHQMYGTAIHSTLREFFESYKKERDMNKKKLVERFEYHLQMQPLTPYDKRDCFKKGKVALEGFYKAYYPLWGRNLYTEYAIRGVHFRVDGSTSIDGKKLLQSLELTGKLDKVELLDSRNVIVTDFKTSKPKSRNELEGKTRDADGNYKRQLVFYKLLILSDKKFRLKYAEIDFVEPNQSGHFKKERFLITEAEVEEVKKQIQKMAQSILGLAFINSKCSDKTCEYCKLGAIVRGIRVTTK